MPETDEPKKPESTPQKNTDDVQALKDKVAALEKEKLEWSSKDMSLNDKAKQEREDQARKSADTKQLESALTFNLTSHEFLKANEALLPKECSDFFKIAEKEKYESPIQKSNSIKTALIQSFFNEQSNLDLLTQSQQQTLNDYLKLTKNGKEEKAKEIYDNLFEPALSTKKRVMKAEELARSKMGYKDASKGDTAYKEKLMAGAKKHFLGEKNV